MEQENLMMELEEAFDQFTWGLNAIELMVLGLAQARDPYFEGFQAVWLYLREAKEEVQSLMDRVSTERTTA